MISDRIKALREEKGLSQAELADLMGVNRMTINNYENNKRMPDVEFAMNCADYFAVTVEYLTGRSEFRHKEDFSKAIEKVQYLADIVDKLPTEEGRQMTNAFAEVLRIAQSAEVSRQLIPVLTNIYIQFSELIMSYIDLVKNMEQSAAELRNVGMDDELIEVVLKEKPMAIFAHGMVMAGNVDAFVREFLGSICR